jgi:hypothetical protein
MTIAQNVAKALAEHVKLEPERAIDKTVERGSLSGPEFAPTAHSRPLRPSGIDVSDPTARIPDRRT